MTSMGKVIWFILMMSMCVCVYVQCAVCIICDSSNQEERWIGMMQNNHEKSNEREAKWSNNIDIESMHDYDGFHENRGFCVHENTSSVCGKIEISYKNNRKIDKYIFVALKINYLLRSIDFFLDRFSRIKRCYYKHAPIWIM